MTSFDKGGVVAELKKKIELVENLHSKWAFKFKYYNFSIIIW